MTESGVILQGSSRSDGNTSRIVEHLNQRLAFDVIDLAKKNIGHFDYEFRNRGDDFLPTMMLIVENYRTIVFATPVYWYSMSGIMKAFFDRITDLLRTEREVGRKLRGMNMAMISCGSDSNLPERFELPFAESAGYLGMNYLGDVHTWFENDQIPVEVIAKLDRFAGEIV